MKATTDLGLASSLAIVLAAAACATGTQDQTGDNPLSDPGDSGQQNVDDSEAGMLTDDAAGVVKGKNPDASSSEPDASQSTGDAAPDAGGGTDAGTDSGTTKPDAGCVVTTENLLVNGALDNGKAPWVLSSASDFATSADLPSFLTPQSGTTCAWLGGTNNANDYIYQPVAIPANATAAHLKGYKWIQTDDFANIDHLSIQTRSAAGTKLEELANLSPGSSDSKWIAFDYTLPNVHAGQTIQIAFIGTTDSSLITNFWIDTLDLEVTYCKY